MQSKKEEVLMNRGGGVKSTHSSVEGWNTTSDSQHRHIMDPLQDVDKLVDEYRRPDQPHLRSESFNHWKDGTGERKKYTKCNQVNLQGWECIFTSDRDLEEERTDGREMRGVSPRGESKWNFFLGLHRPNICYQPFQVTGVQTANEEVEHNITISQENCLLEGWCGRSSKSISTKARKNKKLSPLKAAGG
ncbi:hypothetical protein EVAR_71470_1, partial [Eumeta japonica]